MATPSDLEAWHAQLRTIVEAVADTTRVLSAAEGAVGISDSVHHAAANRSESGFARIIRLVRHANQLAERVGEPALSVPGAAPEIDLRPWWSRLLDKVSATARRNAAAEGLETLRLEADAALLRAVDTLARAGAPRS